MTTTISSIETTIFHLPMYGALRWGQHSSFSEVRHVLVRVRLSDGSSGVAEAPPRPTIYGETVRSIVSIIDSELAPRLIGQPAADPLRIFARMNQIKNNHAAKGGVDMALHAALAQSRGLSLAAHLGATQERVKVSYILGISDRDEMLAEAESVYKQGVRVFKVKVGRNWADDLARIVELQQIYGPSLALYADANECMTPAEAPAKLRQLAEMELLYCEEPLPVEQIQGRAALRADQHLPLIADDSTFTTRDLARELAFDTFDILNIKTARTGYTASQQMLEMAARAGNKGVMIGSQASAGLGTARAGLFAALPSIEHPSELSFFLKLKEDIINRPIPIVDGYVTLADLLAVEVDEELLRAQSYD
ncbi:MAG: enolase C-terminal domain-like protein [Caldilineaceae bacterium]